MCRRHDGGVMDGNAMQQVCAGLAFAEAPRWHGGALWFSDFYTHARAAARPASGELRDDVEVPQPAVRPRLAARRAAARRLDARSPLLRLEPTAALAEHADLVAARDAATATTWWSTRAAAPTSATSASTCYAEAPSRAPAALGAGASPDGTARVAAERARCSRTARSSRPTAAR